MAMRLTNSSEPSDPAPAPRQAAVHTSPFSFQRAVARMRILHEIARNQFAQRERPSLVQQAGGTQAHELLGLLQSLTPVFMAKALPCDSASGDPDGTVEITT